MACWKLILNTFLFLLPSVLRVCWEDFVNALLTVICYLHSYLSLGAAQLTPEFGSEAVQRHVTLLDMNLENSNSDVAQDRLNEVW